jgi:hypothetical protein
MKHHRVRIAISPRFHPAFYSSHKPRSYEWDAKRVLHCGPSVGKSGNFPAIVVPIGPTRGIVDHRVRDLVAAVFVRGRGLLL